MDRLTRRPLLTLEGIAEPFKADGLTNRMRRFVDRLRRRLSGKSRAAQNRQDRDNYRKRMPQAQDGRRNNPNRKIGIKRKSVDKRRGAGFLRGAPGGMR